MRTENEMSTDSFEVGWPPQTLY